MTPVVYLHGFASGPLSTKAQFFGRKFAQLDIPFCAPQLDEGDFSALTVTGQLRVVDRAVNGERVLLMGSSLGGYLAALYAARHRNVERLVLLAPAFQFPTRWRNRFSPDELAEWQRTGVRGFFHYAYKEDKPLGYAFVDDGLKYEDNPDFQQPALILHGTRDDVVPPEASRCFAEGHSNVILKMVESGHELTDVLDLLWVQTAEFLGFQNV